MDDVRIESDERRSCNPRADPPPPAVLAYRAPHEEPPGPTVIDIFKGTAAVGLMLLFLALTLGVAMMFIEQPGVPEGAAAKILVAVLAIPLLFGASLCYRSARDCFTGAIRRSTVGPENDHWSKA